MADLDEPIAGTDPPPDKLGRVLAMQLMLDGASAAKAGDPIESVPHDGQSDDVLERAKAQAWLRGWVRGSQSIAAARLSKPSPEAPADG